MFLRFPINGYHFIFLLYDLKYIIYCNYFNSSYGIHSNLVQATPHKLHQGRSKICRVNNAIHRVVAVEKTILLKKRLMEMEAPF